MTAATSGSAAASTPAGGPRPQLLTIAAILLGVTAVLGLLLPLSLYADRPFVGCSIAVASANATPTATVSGTPTPQPQVTPRATTNAQYQKQISGCLDGTGPVAEISDSDTSSALSQQLISGVFPLLVAGGLAFAAFRGVPLVRWFVVGVWVLCNFIRVIPFSLLQVSGIFASTAPALYSTVLALGFVTLTASAVLVNLPTVTRYFNARRPVRTAAARGGASGRPAAGAGGLFGGLFGSRPPRGGATPPASSGGVSMDKAAGTNPASTRPSKSKGSSSSGGSGNTGRSKGKRRG